MTAPDFIRTWQRKLDALNANRPRETFIIAQELKTAVQLRIQTSGRDYTLTPFVPYVPTYAERRKSKGRQTAHVDFTDTGRLWNNIQPEIVENTPTKTVIVTTARSNDNKNKLRGALRKRGNITLPSKRDLDLAQKANEARLQKYLK